MGSRLTYLHSTFAYSKDNRQSLLPFDCKYMKMKTKTTGELHLTEVCYFNHAIKNAQNKSQTAEAF